MTRWPVKIGQFGDAQQGFSRRNWSSHRCARRDSLSKGLQRWQADSSQRVELSVAGTGSSSGGYNNRGAHNEY
ncbi:hypothetical protein RRG08_020153 [Elysia crispata]|uniref:Uncharacterized protein n=1 Tax=Elysia crispata TaxID=231223 RepID=A0AAE0Y1L1_9GAST|nr:hypothetical protein RRG08_020153 [Elysia crispata]